MLAIAAVIPNISKIFAMLLPRIFPNAMSPLPLTAAMMFTISSGIEVPKATIVNPITNVGIPNFLASDEEPSTR